MKDTISIYDAKTQLSKLINMAKDGEEVIIGAYGKPEVVLVPYKKKNTLKIGVWDHKNIEINDVDLVNSDPEIVKLFEDSINKPFPE